MVSNWVLSQHRTQNVSLLRNPAPRWYVFRIPCTTRNATCSLAPKGSVFVSGSNPNSDYNVAPDVKYKTEYRTEKFYPSYYNERRPQPVGLPGQLAYGGPSFNITLDSNDLFNNVDNVKNTTVILMRTGFSTHSMVLLFLRMVCPPYH